MITTFDTTALNCYLVIDCIPLIKWEDMVMTKTFSLVNILVYVGSFKKHFSYWEPILQNYAIIRRGKEGKEVCWQ